MAKCYKCEKRIPEGAIFCGHCGAPTKLEPNKPQEQPFVQYQVQPYGVGATPDKTFKPKVKPNCDLSVASFVLSIFNPLLCVIAFILSAVALAKKQTRRGLAIAALVISLVEILLIVAACVLNFVFHVDVTQYLPWLKLQ